MRESIGCRCREANADGGRKDRIGTSHRMGASLIRPYSPCPRPLGLSSSYAIAEFPVYCQSLGPKRKQLLILPLIHPGGNCLLSIFVCGKSSDRIIFFHVSPIPIPFLLRRIADVSSQLLLEFCERVDL